jgi:RNA polymerase sigma-70 factor (ECF subfamily)
VSGIIPAATLNNSRDADDRSSAAEPLDFDSLYTRHFEFACRSLRLLGVDPNGLEDAAQDVFGIVARRLAEFEHNANVKTWIFAIVQRVAANHRRARRRKREPLEPLNERTLTTDVGPDAHAEAARAAELIQLFAARLDEPRRTLLVLGLFERMPARELADSLCIPLFTVYSRIRSLREALEAFLRQNEVGT